MPSAANVKIDKQINSDTALGDASGNASTPIRQAITVIEHKIRNLEKRKVSSQSCFIVLIEKGTFTHPPLFVVAQSHSSSCLGKIRVLQRTSELRKRFKSRSEDCRS